MLKLDLADACAMIELRVFINASGATTFADFALAIPALFLEIDLVKPRPVLVFFLKYKSLGRSGILKP
jgi:hypothetical protein